MKGEPRDEEHLRILSIFHYVVAGFTALFSLFPVIHLVIGIAMLTDASDEKAETLLGWLFVIFPTIFILAGWTLAVLIVIAGRALQRRARYTFCLVVAGLSCFIMPFGTVLGAFTIIVLMRDSVRQLFGLPAQAQR